MNVMYGNNLKRMMRLCEIMVLYWQCTSTNVICDLQYIDMVWWFHIVQMKHKYTVQIYFIEGFIYTSVTMDIIGSCDGLVPFWGEATWTCTDMLWIEAWGKNITEIRIKYNCHPWKLIWISIPNLDLVSDLNKVITINSSPPSAGYMRQWIGSALVKIMACHLFATKPLSKPMLRYCQLDP